MILTTYSGTSLFQFTHPGRGATLCRYALAVYVSCFNSRTPGGVRLGHTHRHAEDLPVSIHAPREGCDYTHHASALAPGRFNSRTPGGVRLTTSPSSMRLCPFQFTHPGRGATGSKRSGWFVTMFQFTHPGRGATLEPTQDRLIDLFQFTHPGRGATIEEYPPGSSLSVSIHAPREGCDSIVDTPWGAVNCFNSRTPGGVRRRTSGGVK